MTLRTTCAATLAIGRPYRAMVRRLARDLAAFAPGLMLTVGTDRPSEFRRLANVRAFRIAPSGRWHCYSDKRFVLLEALKRASAVIHIDADTRVIAPLPFRGPWAPGLTAPNESLSAHLRRWWPAKLESFREAAGTVGADFETARWIGEPIYVLARQDGRERRFIEAWGVLAKLLDDRGFRGGEGNVMGLAAARARLSVGFAGWSALNAARRHLNASRASRLAPRPVPLTADRAMPILGYGPKEKLGQESRREGAPEKEEPDEIESGPRPPLDPQGAEGPQESPKRARLAHGADPAHGRNSADGRDTADRTNSADRTDPSDRIDPADGARAAHRVGADHGVHAAGPDRAARRKVARRPEVTVVIVSRDEGKNLRRTVSAVKETAPSSVEILVVDDGSTDGSADFLSGSKAAARLLRAAGLGVTKARNFGARGAKGDALIFADAHVEPSAGWLAPMLETIGRPGVGAASPAVSVMGRPELKGYGLRLKASDLSTQWLRNGRGGVHAAPIVPGCFLAMSRRTFEATGGFDEGMSTWGMSDIELSVRLWLLGYEQLVVPDVVVAHLFRKKHPYQVRWKSFLHNKARLAFLHFNAARVGRVFEAIKGHSEFAAAMAMLAEGDSNRRRGDLAARRRRDDDWYFSRFCAGLTI